MSEIEASAPQASSFTPVIPNAQDTFKSIATEISNPGLIRDPEFASLMPAHAPEEHAGLTKSVIEEKGCREPLYAWHDREQNKLLLLDGYTRHKICLENNISLPKVVQIDLPNRDAAREWIISQQLNRRNLNAYWLAYFRGVKYNSEKLAAHRPAGSNTELPQTEGETAQKLAEKAGVSRATIERNADFAKAVECLKQDISNDFGKKVLNREFEKLSMGSVKELAKKSPEAKKAIAAALEKDPKLSLLDAVKAIHPPKAAKPDKLLAKFKKQQEDTYTLLCDIQQVKDVSDISKMLEMADKIIKKLREIEAASR